MAKPIHITSASGITLLATLVFAVFVAPDPPAVTGVPDTVLLSVFVAPEPPYPVIAGQRDCDEVERYFEAEVAAFTSPTLSQKFSRFERALYACGAALEAKLAHDSTALSKRSGSQIVLL